MEWMGNEPQNPNRTLINPGLQFHNAIISGGDFKSIQGSYYHQNFQCSESGLFALSQSIARGATHDSVERYPPGKCHAGTREEIINIILDWINDPNPASDVLWLYGPPGAGKSAIMQSIAELLLETPYDSEGRYAGSFFFGRDIDGRCDGKSLFSTLAHQIAMRLPGMRALINDAMNSDHTLPHKSMAIQLQSLIIEPLARSSSFLHTPTIIIDGLDECRESRTQREILSLITNARIKSLVPLRFLIASRPEYWIRECFDSKPLFDITKRISLSESRDADKDIKKYLQDGFAQIYTENLDIMGEVEQPWPSERIIDYFVHKASGQFIYASTVLKFVGQASDFHDPQEQLDIISTPGPLQASAFSDLDELYTRILSVYPKREELLTVLGGLLAGAQLQTIKVFLGVRSSGLKMTLRALESLALFLPPRQVVADPDLDKLYGQDEIKFFRFHHLSFHEYLKDTTRSGPFAIDAQTLTDRLCDKFFDTLVDSLKGIMTYINVPVFHYCSAWSDFCYSLAPKASPWKMQNRIEDLLARLLEVRCGNHHFQDVQLKYLLRHLQYAEDLIKIIGDPKTFGHKDPFHMDKCLMDNLLANIRAMQDSTIREIMTMDFLSMMAYFMYSTGYSLTSSNLYYLSEASNDTITSFFLQNVHFFDGLFHIADRAYRPLYCVFEFLSSLSRGQDFHIKFRSRCIWTCRSLLLCFFCPVLVSGDLGVAERNQGVPITIPILHQFFLASDLSNIALLRDPEDVQSMQSIIDIMHRCNWKQLSQICLLEGYDSALVTIIFLLNWLCRNLDDLSFLSENPNSPKMVKIISHIYNDVILPELIAPYFSELFMYNVVHEVEISTLDIGDIGRPTAFVHGAEAEYFWAISTISCILKESRYELGINSSDWFTTVSEFYLHLLAKNRYAQLDADYRSYDGIPKTLDFDLWLLHAMPTDKILMALRAIRYLCLKQPRRWRAPPGFCSFAIGLLQKFESDESGLITWFENLRVNELKREDDEKD